MEGFKRFVITGAAVVLTGCSGFESVRTLDRFNNGELDYKSDRPACEIQAADYRLDTRVVSFEITSSNGLDFGFNLLSGFLRLFGISFKTKEGRMAMTMKLADPIQPHYELMNTLGSALMKDREFKFQLGIEQFNLGFEHYSRTPVATLAERALEDTVVRMNAQIAGLQESWSSQVIAVPNRNEVIIAAGSYAGVKIGDEFAIYNVEHIWKGVPCESEHLFERKTTSGPLLYGVVTDIRNIGALLSVRPTGDSRTDMPVVDQGARVEISKLVNGRQALSRTLEIGEVIGAEMKFDNNLTVDLTQYLREQINAVVHRNGYVIYK